MQKLMSQMVREDDGVLSFEWTLLLTLLTIGIVSGLAGARDAIIDELGDVAQAAVNFDQSYSLAGINIPGVFVSPASEFDEATDDVNVYTDCDRNVNVSLPGQNPQIVEDSADGG